jgi:hypothetical protein
LSNSKNICIAPLRSIKNFFTFIDFSLAFSFLLLIRCEYVCVCACVVYSIRVKDIMLDTSIFKCNGIKMEISFVQLSLREMWIEMQLLYCWIMKLVHLDCNVTWNVFCLLKQIALFKHQYLLLSGIWVVVFFFDFFISKQKLHISNNNFFLQWPWNATFYESHDERDANNWKNILSLNCFFLLFILIVRKKFTSICSIMHNSITIEIFILI